MAKFNIGDRVVCMDPVGALEAGRIYQITAYRSSNVNHNCFVDLMGSGCGWNESRFELHEAARDIAELAHNGAPVPVAAKRVFATGASRDTVNGKLDYEAFLSPTVLDAYAQYMCFHQRLRDGSVRDGDNWQKGMPMNDYIKSGFRHLIDWWSEHRHLASREGLVFALCGVIFNAMGYLHEYIKAHPGAVEKAIADAEAKLEGAVKCTSS